MTSSFMLNLPSRRFLLRRAQTEHVEAFGSNEELPTRHGHASCGVPGRWGAPGPDRSARILTTLGERVDIRISRVDIDEAVGRGGSRRPIGPLRCLAVPNGLADP